MDNALYVGLSRQMTLQRQLDIAANNLANVDTAGFKVESLMLQSDPLTPPNGAALRPGEVRDRRRPGPRLQPGRAGADRRNT